VGDKQGRVIEYQEGSNKETWTKVKDYGDLGIGWIVSVDQIEDVLVFGGYETYSIRAIDSVNKTLLSGTLKTAFEDIYSLQVCELPKNKVFLSVCGGNPDYLNNQTDIFDAKELARKFNFQFQRNLKSSSLEEDKNVQQFSEKSEIQTLNQTSCGCDTRKDMGILLSKMAEYFYLFRKMIFSDFDKKLEKILSKSFLCYNK
jgi:hypothetical protein